MEWGGRGVGKSGEMKMVLGRWMSRMIVGGLGGLVS